MRCWRVFPLVLTFVAMEGLCFSVEEDFAVQTPRGGAYGIDIERHSALSHRHGWVEEGDYLIPVDGNIHLIAAPALGDFRLAVDYTLEPFRRNDLTAGFAVFFRHGRATGHGHRLEIFYDRETKLHFSLDGKDLLVRPDGKFVDLSNQSLTLEVKGRCGHAETLGASVDFELADGPASGSVGFDLTTNESVKLRLHRFALSSPEEPPTTPVGHWTFALARSQGFAEGPSYEVTADRYSSGETRFRCRLSGTILSAPKRADSGGHEWIALAERLSDPYVKVTDVRGKEHVFFFWNGRRQLEDPHFTGKLPFSWPLERTFVVRDFPDDFTVSAGYGRAVDSHWRFAANGPYEQVRSRAGAFVYEGSALGRSRIALRVTSPGEKKVAARLPADLPNRAAAERHAREQHYFLASETPVFTCELVWRKSDFDGDEILVDPRLETVFGEKTDIALVPADDERTEDIGAGLVRRTCSFRMACNPGIGVWHLETRLDAGQTSASRTERTVFEVLSDTPGGKAPPLVSGLPEFVSMPNEVKYLEESAFDPWSAFGGVSHYYSIDMRYPAVGDRLRVWEADHAYDRKYFTWVMRRNSDDTDLTHAVNRERMRHADYFGGYPKGKDFRGQIDLAMPCVYHDFQLEVLTDFIRERGLKLELLTPERLAAAKKDGKGITSDELKEIFDADWNGFKAYARQRTDVWVRSFADGLLAENPKLARASYGPFNVYVGVYKSPYAFETISHPIESDPRIRANGSFWLLEDYHYSCDYPLCRPAYLTAGCCLYYPNGRRLFPEIYYQGWTRCEDGAVYQAHPTGEPPLAWSHQRRIVFQYVYGTAFRRDDGSFGFWTDDGFHARNPEREAMDAFVRAWGQAQRNRPVRPLAAPTVFVDADAFRRRGDTFMPDGTWRVEAPGTKDVRADIVNLGEEAVGWAYERCCAEGYPTPTVARLAAADRIGKEECPFAVVPPLVKGTPAAVIGAVRRLHERGVNLLAFEAAEGLEDLFDVSGTTDFARKETRWGRTVFQKRPPTTVARASFLARFSRGRENVSEALDHALAGSFAYLSPADASKAERGALMASVTRNGDYAVVVSDDSPLYGDTTAYPVSFRFVVSAPGIGTRAIVADVPYSVVERSADRIVLRTETQKDDAHLFVFKEKREH